MKRAFLISLVLLATSCTNDSNRPDCSLVLCAANDPIQLEVIQDGMNIFVSGDITTEDVIITGTREEEVSHTVSNSVQGTVEALLTITQFGLYEDDYIYSIQIDTSILFDLQVTYRLSDRDPCCGQRLLIREVTSDDVIVTEMQGHYRVLLD